MGNEKSFRERKLEERYNVILEQMKHDFEKKNLSMRKRGDILKYLDDLLWTFSTYGALVGFAIGMMLSVFFLWLNPSPGIWTLLALLSGILLIIGAKQIGDEHIKVEQCSKLLK